MSDLLTSTTADRYTVALNDIVERLSKRFREVRRPFSGASRSTLQSLVDEVDLNRPGTGTTDAIRELDELFVEHAVWFHDSGYMSHLNCPVVLPAVAAEAVLAAVNTSVDTYDQSAIGTLMERKLVSWTAERIGFPAGDGVFTSGGTQSNLHALLLARESATARATAERQAVAGRRIPQRSTSLHDLLERMVVLATEYSHFSVQKSARLLGLGAGSVVTVPTDAHGRMNPAALKVTLDALVQAGHLPIAVVATAGTTDRGCIDPLADIAEACERAGVWMHVDAAYGGGLLVSPTRRHLLAGIERADSVTVDFHKTFFQPVSSSAIIVRDAATLEPVAWHADYLNPVENDEPNQVDKSLQTTRRFDALKLWATLRALGADEIGALFDRVIELAAETHDLLADTPDFELIGRTDLSTVLFRYAPSGRASSAVDELVPLIRSVLLDSGRAFVAKTVIDGRPCLKLTLLNPETTMDDIRRVLDLVRSTGDALLEHHDILGLTEESAR